MIDETGFLKQRRASCGVARQYTGSAGKITNCQVGVFAALVSRHGHAFVDRALYPPKTWTDDVTFRDDECRLRTNNAPANFTTTKHIALNLIRKAKGKDSLRLRRKLAAWDDNFLASLVTE